MVDRIDSGSMACRRSLLICYTICFFTAAYAQGPAGLTCNTVDPPVSHWSFDVGIGPGYGSVAGLDAFGGGSVEYSLNPFAGVGLQAFYGATTNSLDLIGYGSLNLSNLTAPFRTGFWKRTNVFARAGTGIRLPGSMLVLAGLSGEYNLSNALALELGSDLVYGPDKVALTHVGLRYKFGVLSRKHARNISMNEFRPQPSPIIIQRTIWVGNEAAEVKRIEAMERSNDSLQVSLQVAEETLTNYKELLASQEAARVATKAVNKSNSKFGIAVTLPVVDAPAAPIVMTVAPSSAADSASIIAALSSSMAKKVSVLTDRSVPQLKVPNVVTGTTDPVEFLSGYSQLTPDSKLILNEMASILLSKNWKSLTIVGNTDNQGAPQNNKALSLKRAIIVRDYLKSKGLPFSKLKVRGDGGTNPIDSNKTALGKRLNRRVDFILE